MPFDRASTGKSHGPYRMQVNAAAIERFTRALREDNPHFVDGYRRGGIVAPPAFALVLTAPALRRALADPDLGVPTSELVPVECDLRFTKAVKPGHEILVTACFEAFEIRPEGDVVTVRIEGARRSGLPLFEVRARLLHLEQHPEAQPPIPPEPVTGFLRPALAFRAQTIVKAGPPFLPDPKSPPPKLRTATREFIRHALALAYAAKGIIDNSLKRDPSQLKRIAASLIRPVEPGETLDTAAWIVESRRGSTYFGFEALAGDGAVVLADGNAEVILK